MENLDSNSDQYATIYSNSSSSSSSSGGVNSNNSYDNNANNNSSAGTVTWYGMRLPSVSTLRSPLSFLLDYSGVLSSTHDSEAVIINNGVTASELGSQIQIQSLDVGGGAAAAAAGTPCTNSAGEVAIRIIGAGENDHNVRLGSLSSPPSSSSWNRHGEVGYGDCDLMSDRGEMPALDDGGGEGGRGGIAVDERVPLVSSSSSLAGSGQVDGDAGNGLESNGRDSSSYQRYDIQQVAKWIEQILPFSLLLLVVFIRQHLQGITTSVWIGTVMLIMLILASKALSRVPMKS